MNITQLALILTAFTSALIAGLFFGWSVSVIPGLGRLPDKEYVSALQACNRAILNPLFLGVFLGTAILMPLTSFLLYSSPAPVSFWLMLAACALYVIGTFGLTMVGNVPLNNMIDAFNISSATPGEISSQRLAFEGPWNKLHSVRTLCSALASVFAIAACFYRGSESL